MIKVVALKPRIFSSSWLKNLSVGWSKSIKPEPFKSPEHQAFANDQLLNLTRKEYDLLLFFMANRGRIVTKESIVEHLWGDNVILTDSFDFVYTHVKNLRKKLLAHNCGNYIKVIYGFGYKFCESWNYWPEAHIIFLFSRFRQWLLQGQYFTIPSVQ